MKIKQFVRSHVGTIITALLVLLCFVLFFWDMIFITIYPGHKGVLFRRVFQQGTDTEKAYPEGLNIIWPWNEMFIYNVRIQEKKQVVNVLSQNGLTIQVNVSVRYYVDKDRVPILHQMVGPDYERKIIIPSTISSVREVVGEYLPEQLYTTKRYVIQDRLLIEVIEETGRIPIIYDDVIVENIKLPDLINRAIEAKLHQQQQYLEYQYKIQQAEAEIIRKKNEAIGIRQYQDIVSKSLTPELLKWKGIMATLELAKSPNSKVIVVGGGEGGLPIIFNAEGTLNPSASTTAPESGYDQDLEAGRGQNRGTDDGSKDAQGKTPAESIQVPASNLPADSTILPSAGLPGVTGEAQRPGPKDKDGKTGPDPKQ